MGKLADTLISVITFLPLVMLPKILHVFPVILAALYIQVDF